MSNVKSDAAPIMLLPFLATTQVATPDLFEIFMESPALGLAGSVKVKFAVNTYRLLAVAFVFEFTYITPIVEATVTAPV